MSQISRLRDAEIANGNLIDADDIDVELNQLVLESNNQDTRLSTLESSTITISGTKTFTGNNTHSGTNAFSGKNTFSNQIVIAHTTDPTTPDDGAIWYNSTDDKLHVQVGGNKEDVVLASDLGLPGNYISGPNPTYNAAASITIPAGLRARSSDNTDDIVVGSNITLTLASSGASGLDTGSEASNTWYYVYLIKKPSDGTVSAVFSTTNEAVSGSITLPTDYTLKRQLPIAVRNDNSSNIISFQVGHGWPYRPFIFYDTTMSYYPSALDATSNVGPTNILNGGTATSFTAVSMTSFVPTGIATQVILSASRTGNSPLNLRPTGESHNGIRILTQTSSSGGGTTDTSPLLKVGTSGQVDYKTTSGDCRIDVYGFVVTEVF